MALTEKQVGRISELYADLQTVNWMLADAKKRGMTLDLSSIDKEGKVPNSLTIPKLLALGVLDTMRESLRNQLKDAGCAV